MTARKNSFSRIRLVYRRSSTLLKCVVLAAIVLATAALLTLHFSIRQTKAQTDELRSQAARLEQENRELKENIAMAGTVQSIKRIATEELDLVDPEAEFFYPVEQNP